MSSVLEAFATRTISMLTSAVVSGGLAGVDREVVSKALGGLNMAPDTLAPEIYRHVGYPVITEGRGLEASWRCSR